MLTFMHWFYPRLPQVQVLDFRKRYKSSPCLADKDNDSQESRVFYVGSHAMSLEDWLYTIRLSLF